MNNAGVALYDDLGDRAVLEQHLAVNLGAVPGHSRLRSIEGHRLQHDPVAAGPARRPGVKVHAGLTGSTDTDMTRGIDIPKASAESVASAGFDGVEAGEEDIFPDPMSGPIAHS